MKYLKFYCWIVFLVVISLISCQREENIPKEVILLQEAQAFFEKSPKNKRFLIEPRWENFEQGGKNQAGELYAYTDALVKNKYEVKLLIIRVNESLMMNIVFSPKSKKSLIITDLQGKPKEYYAFNDGRLKTYFMLPKPKISAFGKNCNKGSCFGESCKFRDCNCSCHKMNDFQFNSLQHQKSEIELDDFLGDEHIDYRLEEVVVEGNRPKKTQNNLLQPARNTGILTFIPDFGLNPFKNGNLFDKDVLKNIEGGGNNTIDKTETIEHELDDYECAKAIFEKLPTLNNDIAKLLQETFGVSDDISVTFYVDNSLKGTDTDGVNKTLNASKSSDGEVFFFRKNWVKS